MLKGTHGGKHGKKYFIKMNGGILLAPENFSSFSCGPNSCLFIFVDPVTDTFETAVT